MNIRIGDIVRFISEKMEGKVTGIIDNTTVNIFVDDYGFEIPASTSDLVVIHSDFTPSKPDSSSVTQVQKGVTMESGDTLYFAIVPDNFNNLPDSRYELFLVNDTQQTCLYSIAFRHGEKYSGISAGNCNPDSTCPIGTYSKRYRCRYKSRSYPGYLFQERFHDTQNSDRSRSKNQYRQSL